MFEMLQSRLAEVKELQTRNADGQFSHYRVGAKNKEHINEQQRAFSTVSMVTIAT